MHVEWSAESLEALQESERVALDGGRRSLEVDDLVAALLPPAAGRAAALLERFGFEAMRRSPGELGSAQRRRSSAPAARSEALSAVLRGAWISSNASVLGHVTTAHLLGCALSHPDAQGHAIEAGRGGWTSSMWDGLRRETRLSETLLASVPDRWRIDAGIPPGPAHDGELGPGSFRRLDEGL